MKAEVKVTNSLKWSGMYKLANNTMLSVYECIVTPHAQRERGKVIDRGVHIYVCGRKKYLNRTLEIDSPF